jgi:hypothetical protein
LQSSFTSSPAIALFARSGVFWHFFFSCMSLALHFILIPLLLVCLIYVEMMLLFCGFFELLI